MEILLILFVLGLVIFVLLVLNTLIKWIIKTKKRAIGVSASLLAVLVGFGIYQLFFVKLAFIQSKVYPDLYLVKNFPEEKSTLNAVIKDFVMRHVKTKPTTLRFYKYYKSYNPLVFGDSGTAYFIDNEEDLGGMVVEDLGMYMALKIATLSKTDCEDELGYCARLDYFEEGRKVKTHDINITVNYNK